MGPRGHKSTEERRAVARDGLETQSRRLLTPAPRLPPPPPPRVMTVRGGGYGVGGMSCVSC